jgi:hypothetical protein
MNSIAGQYSCTKLIINIPFDNKIKLIWIIKIVYFECVYLILFLIETGSNRNIKNKPAQNKMNWKGYSPTYTFAFLSDQRKGEGSREKL